MRSTGDPGALREDPDRTRVGLAVGALLEPPDAAAQEVGEEQHVLVGLRPAAPELAEGEAGHRGGDDRAVLARGERGRAGAGPVAEERRRDRAGPLGVQLLTDLLVEAVPGGVAQRQPGGALVARPPAVDQAGGRGVEEVVDLLPVAGADVDAPQLLLALPEGEPPRVALAHRHQPLARGRLGRGERDVRVQPEDRAVDAERVGDTAVVALVLGAQRAALVEGSPHGLLAWPKSWPRKLAPSPAEA